MTLSLPVVLLALPSLLAPASAAPLRPRAGWLAGAASASVLPLVNGSRAYYTGPPDELDGDSPGVFVPAFDDGTIAIGNGARESYWVHDDVRVSALALRAEDNATTLVLLSADLYQFFEPDLAGVHAAVGAALGSDVEVLVSSSHTHEGPDTSGLTGINRSWFEQTLETMAQTAIAAASALEPATVVASDTAFAFGQGDNRDPRVLDRTVNVLQARSVDGRVIGTAVNWAYHPEVTLGFSPPVSPSDCAALEAMGETCSARGRYISADFPFYLRRYVQQKYGDGPVLFIAGALANQIGPNNDKVWEVSEAYPLTGDGSEVPPGAPLVDKSFRKTVLVGRELAFAVIRALEESPRAREVAPAPIEIRTTTFFSRLTNLAFRAGLAPAYRNADRPIVIGYHLRELFVCADGAPPSAATCVLDEFETVEIAGFALPVRKGNFIRTTVSHVRLGDVQLITIPGELPPEVASGLPDDFDGPDTIEKFYERPEQHAIGKDYTMPGVLKAMMEVGDGFAWPLGLTLDAGGYFFPISDWRISCWGPDCTDGGDLAPFISGEDCKALLDAGDNSDGPIASCLIGQVSQWERHYEEINAPGWDICADYVAAVGDLLGVEPWGRYEGDWKRRVEV